MTVRCVAHGRMARRREFRHAAEAAAVPVAWTRERGEIERLVRDAVAAGCERVLVAGGDGSILEAANVLRGGAVPLGIIPGGTGNDLARGLGVPSDLPEALRVALEGRVRVLDVGLARFSSGGTAAERAFVNIAEAGFGGKAVARVQRLGRYVGRRLAYPVGILSALAGYRPAPATVTLDGDAIVVPRFTNLVVANGRYFGRGLKPAPRAELDDGLFDVLLMQDLSAREIATRFPELRDGPPPGDPKLRSFRARRVEVAGPAHLLVEADGEVLGNVPARFEIVPRALRVVVP